MLITQLKAKEAITSLTAGKKVFIINCHGCKEVRFPEKDDGRSIWKSVGDAFPKCSDCDFTADCYIFTFPETLC